MVNNIGEYPPTINLGYLNAGGTLKIKLLVPNLRDIDKIDKIELHQGTYTNYIKFDKFLNFDSNNIA